MKEINENDDIDANLPRAVTKKSSQETDAFGRSDLPDLDNNLQIISKKSGPDNDSKIDQSKKLNIDSNNIKQLNIKRMDSFGNPIIKKGKQKISFKTQNKLVEFISIESYKEYNKMEEISHYNNMQNNCCIIE